MERIGLKRRALVGLMALAAVVVVGFLFVGRHADARRMARADRAPHRLAAVRLLGTADLFLSSSSRWIRHASLSEPGAAFADGPAILDTDPAGGIVGPVPTLWTGFGAELSARRRR